MIILKVLLFIATFAMLGLFFGVFLYMALGAIIYSFFTNRAPGRLGKILCRPFTAWGVWCLMILPAVSELIFPAGWPLRLLQAILLLFSFLAADNIGLWPIAAAQAAFNNRHGDYIAVLAGLETEKGNYEVDPVLRPVFYTVFETGNGTRFTMIVDLIARKIRRAVRKAAGSPTPKPAPSR